MVELDHLVLAQDLELPVSHLVVGAGVVLVVKVAWMVAEVVVEGRAAHKVADAGVHALDVLPVDVAVGVDDGVADLLPGLRELVLVGLEAEELAEEEALLLFVEAGEADLEDLEGRGGRAHSKVRRLACAARAADACEVLHGDSALCEEGLLVGHRVAVEGADPHHVGREGAPVDGLVDEDLLDHAHDARRRALVDEADDDRARVALLDRVLRALHGLLDAIREDLRCDVLVHEHLVEELDLRAQALGDNTLRVFVRVNDPAHAELLGPEDLAHQRLLAQRVLLVEVPHRHFDARDRAPYIPVAIELCLQIIEELFPSRDRRRSALDDLADYELKDVRYGVGVEVDEPRERLEELGLACACVAREHDVLPCAAALVEEHELERKVGCEYVLLGLEGVLALVGGDAKRGAHDAVHAVRVLADLDEGHHAERRVCGVLVLALLCKVHDDGLAPRREVDEARETLQRRRRVLADLLVDRGVDGLHELREALLRPGEAVIAACLEVLLEGAVAVGHEACEAAADGEEAGLALEVVSEGLAELGGAAVHDVVALLREGGEGGGGLWAVEGVERPRAGLDLGVREVELCWRGRRVRDRVEQRQHLFDSLCACKRALVVALRGDPELDVDVPVDGGAHVHRSTRALVGDDSPPQERV